MGNEDYEKITSANIMIIDEDVNMMEVLSAVLKKYGHVVKAYTEPISAIEELKSQKYDILIVNYLMSTVNGDKIIELVIIKLGSYLKSLFKNILFKSSDLVHSIPSSNCKIDK